MVFNDIRQWLPATARPAVLIVLLLSMSSSSSIPTSAPLSSVLVQGDHDTEVVAAVRAVGGEITHHLAIIDAVAARLDPAQIERLRRHPAVDRLYENRAVELTKTDEDGSSKAKIRTHYPKLVDAHRLHKRGVLGDGASLAVLDTGALAHPALLHDSRSNSRVLAHYDAIEGVELPVSELSDGAGHGSHVTSIAVNSSAQNSSRKKFNGMAPDADLVVVRAFNDSGRATYADVIRGLDWILANKDWYNVRVLNLSFSAPARSHYWDDPLNQAVMALWRDGVTVVAAAGNGGPDPMTISVPGNIPYVITVGAMTDDYTVDGSDDRLASFSAAGPTAEGFIKPELVAPGGHIQGLVPSDSMLAEEFSEFLGRGSYFVMSGTSQAAAVVSGAALLMLGEDPHLSPDDVKCRLMASARTAVDEEGQLAYSPLQQGAGRLDAHAAFGSTFSGCANRGLDIELDLAGIEHYAGPVRLSEDGTTFYTEGTGYSWDAAYTPEGHLWTGGNPWIDASLWSSGNPWIDASAWSSGNPWIDASGNPWIDASGNPWIDASGWWNTAGDWSPHLTEGASINPWVDQE